MLAISTHTAVKILCFHTIVEIARHHITILVLSEERGVVVTCLNTALIFTAGNKAFHHIVTCYLRIAETCGNVCSAIVLKTVIIVISCVETVVIAICQIKILCLAFRGGIVMAFLLADRVAAAP